MKTAPNKKVIGKTVGKKKIVKKVKQRTPKKNSTKGNDEWQDLEEKQEQEQEPSTLINSSIINDVKINSFRKRIMTKTAQKQWEELPNDSIEEVIKLLNIHIEPTLKSLNNNATKETSNRKMLNGLINDFVKELQGILVPIGANPQMFNIDYLLKKVSVLQKNFQELNSQNDELKKLVIKEEANYQINLNYLEKLQKNFKIEEKNFNKNSKLLSSSSLNSLKIVDDFDSINLINNESSSFNANDDENLKPLLQQFNNHLKNLNNSSAFLKTLNNEIDLVNELLT